jgi:hypothetical protein
LPGGFGFPGWPPIHAAPRNYIFDGKHRSAPTVPDQSYPSIIRFGETENDIRLGADRGSRCAPAAPVKAAGGAAQRLP